MTDADQGPWPIRLKRSPMRLLLVVGLRAGIGVVGIATASRSPGAIGIVLTITGLIVLGYSLLLGLHLATLRLEARRGELRLSSVFGGRSYRLRKGELRRRRLPASWRSPLEARVGGLGVSLGSGVLEGEALVGVIALDRSATLIMVPVTGGRLAVAPASEEELLAALAAATRA
jgi:hypothetical protein